MNTLENLVTKLRVKSSNSNESVALQARQERILNTIYDAVLRPTSWSDVLNDLMALVDGEQAVLTRLDVEDGTGVALTTEADATTQKNYFDYYYAINPLQLVKDPVAYARDWAPLILRDEDIIPREKYEASEYYNDFIRPLGAEWGTIIRLGLAGRDVTAIALGRSYKTGRFEDDEIARLGWLHPHLIRAAKLGEAFGALKGLSAGLMAALNQVPAAMLLVGTNTRLLYANEAGERFLADGAMLSVRQKRLTAPSQVTADALAAAIAHAATPLEKGGGASSVQLRAATRRLPLTASVMPLTLDDAANFVGGRAVLISIAEPVAGSIIPSEILAEKFTLTPAEIRLANALAGGSSLRDIGEHQRISVNTVRAQLASIFAKTGTNRQVDLIKLLMGFG